MKKFFTLALALVLALSLTACGNSGNKTIKVGATPAPHCEILEVAKEVLAKDGYTLEIQEFNDYVVPNTAVEAEMRPPIFRYSRVSTRAKSRTLSRFCSSAWAISWALMPFATSSRAYSTRMPEPMAMVLLSTTWTRPSYSSAAIIAL